MKRRGDVVILEERIEGEERIIKMKVGRTDVTVRRPLVPKQEDIIRLYDTCNRLFKDHPECFYTPEQTKEKNRLLAEQRKAMESKGSLLEQ